MDSGWEPAFVNLSQSLLSGGYLIKKDDKKKKKRTLIVCQTVINADQTRIYIRSPIQVRALL